MKIIFLRTAVIATVVYVLSFGPIVYMAVKCKLDPGHGFGFFIAMLYRPHILIAGEISLYEKYLSWWDLTARD